MKGKIRWFPAIVGGLLGGIAIYFLTSLLLKEPQIWILFLGWIVVGYLAGTGKNHAWGRVWLVLCIVCFATPIASFIFAASTTSEMVSSTTNELEQAGAAIGGAIGTTMITGISAFFGFFLGIIFAILSYFGLREPKH